MKLPDFTTPGLDKLFLILILIASFFLRVYNLDYNAPERDEAIYVVIGRMGLFHMDWGTFNAASWMAGQPFLYPSLSASAYMLGGIVGSRLLSAIIGTAMVAIIYRIAWILAPLPRSNKLLSAITAAILVGGATLTLAVSRLATYDMLSFFLVFLSILYLAKAYIEPGNLAKNFLLAVVWLYLSFLSKIITVAFVPLAIVITYFLSKQRGTEYIFYWKRYFFWPLVIISALYFIPYAPELFTYGVSQTTLARSSIPEVLAEIWNHANIFLILYAAGSIGLLIRRQFRLWLLLSSGALAMIFIHLATFRLPTIEKHLMLSTSFIAILFAISISSLIFLIKRSWVRKATIIALLLLTLPYTAFSYNRLQEFNIIWQDSTPATSFLAQRVKNGETVLSEEGPAMILAMFDRTFPANVTTFDWLEYRDFTGDQAYREALQDGYFNYIELQISSSEQKDALHEHISQLVREHIETNYHLIHQDGAYQLYARNF